jgi:hypothetical protein
MIKVTDKVHYLYEPGTTGTVMSTEMAVKRSRGGHGSYNTGNSSTGLKTVTMYNVLWQDGSTGIYYRSKLVKS